MIKELDEPGANHVNGGDSPWVKGIGSSVGTIEVIDHPYALDAEAVKTQLQTSDKGLTYEEAKHRLDALGPNALPTPKPPNLLIRFFKQCHHLLIYVLLGASVVTLSLGHLIDTAVILAVVLVNALIGLIQEGKADQALRAIQQLLSLKAQVIREGQAQTLDAADVVIGDVVVLHAGDRVPADGRLIMAQGLMVDEAILTGESMPVEKGTEANLTQTAIADQTSMVFSGTLITQGQAQAVITATGPKTQMGQISHMVLGVQRLTTPLVQQMAVFARYLTLAILAVAALVLGLGELFEPFAGDLSFSDRLMAVVGLSVAAIPEGLPAILTITLAVGVQAMARRQAIVRHLPAIETLGAVSVICTDKTGTLTRNEMMVTACWLGDGDIHAKMGAKIDGQSSDSRYAITGEGYGPMGEIHPVCVDQDGPLTTASRIARLCNDAHLSKGTIGQWQVEGDPMEGALLAFASKVDAIATDQDSASDQENPNQPCWQRIDALPFDARHRYMATVDRLNNGEYWVHVKGAPETLMTLIATQNPQDADFNDSSPKAWLDRWSARVDEMTHQGQRVLALSIAGPFADPPDLNRSLLETHLQWIGVVGIIDPPRAEVKEAIAACRAAGIDVKMITGDHMGTASAIARDIGLLPKADEGHTRDNLASQDQAITGDQLDAWSTSLSKEQWAQAVQQTKVFARTNPEHKLKLVQALQAQGLTVAMTGDGVNDAPALKQADAGVAMGRTGSQVAREAADLVLADDHFESIVAAVSQGRTVYENVKKVIAWTLPTSAGEAMVIVVALLLGLSLPISPVQILWINLITATTLGIVLAFEPVDPQAMRRPPRPREEPLLSGALLWHMGLVSGLFLIAVFGIYQYAIWHGLGEAVGQTLALNTLVVLEIFHLFFIRSLYQQKLTMQSLKGNAWVWGAVGVVLIAQALITFVPILQSVFGTTSVSLGQVGMMVMVGGLFLLVVEAEKRLRGWVLGTGLWAQRMHQAKRQAL